MDFKRIQIFSYLDDEKIAVIKTLFEPKIIPEGELLISYGDEVSGLFIIEEGKVAVLGQDNLTPIAALTAGASFGEMSFLAEGYKASASIVVASETVAVLYCRKEIFEEFLKNEPEISDPFYKGAAILIADRLREANNEITRGAQFVASIIDASKVDLKLGKTRSILDKIGGAITSQLFDLISDIDATIAHCPAARAELETVKSKIQSIVFEEGQNFDRIVQQLDHIFQHFNNLKCIVHGGTPEAVLGDVEIFEEREADGEFTLF